MESITLGVRSLEVARKFLAERQWLQRDDGIALWMAWDGLQIRLQETAPTAF